MEKGKEFLFGQEVREKLWEGVDLAYQAVKHTFGSHSRHTLIEQSFGPPKAISDGYKTICDFTIQDVQKNTGLELVKEMVKKMHEEVGDGTTTTILLLRSLVEEINKYIACGHDPIAVKRSLDDAMRLFLDALKKESIPVKTKEEIAHIATAAAGGASEVGSMIRDAVEKVGREGLIVIDESKNMETELKVVEGLKIDRGLLSPYFAKDVEKGTTELHKARILVTDRRISSPQEILGVLQAVMISREPLLIIAADLEGEALATLVINKMRGVLNVCAVKAPSFGDQQREILEDIALLTGAQFVTEEKGMDLKKAEGAVLGSAEKIFISKEETLIMQGKGNKKEIEERVISLKAALEKGKNSYEKDRISKRIAHLSCGICQILVGAHSEIEMKERKAKFLESLAATKAALQEGMVVGGGVGLLFAASSLKENTEGAIILKKALMSLIHVLTENVGVEASPLIEEILKKGSPFGFNVVSQKVEDLFKAGVIDAYRVLSSAIQYAVSTAGVIALSEVALIDAGEA